MSLDISQVEKIARRVVVAGYPGLVGEFEVVGPQLLARIAHAHLGEELLTGEAAGLAFARSDLPDAIVAFIVYVAAEFALRATDGGTGRRECLDRLERQLAVRTGRPTWCVLYDPNWSNPLWKVDQMLRPKTKVQPPWGEVYSAGKVDIALVVEAVTDVARRHNLLVRETLTSATSVTVEGFDVCPWWRQLLHALPQCFSWDIAKIHDEVLVRCDRRQHAWYRVVVAFCCAAAITLSCICAHAMFIGHINPLDPRHLPFQALLVLCVSVSFFATWRMLSASSAKAEGAMDLLHATLRRDGIRLDYQPRRSRSRWYLKNCIMLSTVGLSLIPFVVEVWLAPPSSSPPVWAAVFMLVLLCVAASLCGIVVDSRRPGLTGWLGPVILGLEPVFIIFLTQAGQFVFFVLGEIDAELWERIDVARDLLIFAQL